MGKYQKVAVAPEEYRQYFDYQPEMKHYEIVDSVAKLRKLSAKMASIEEFAFDTETNSLRAYGLNSCFLMVCITISWGQYNNYYIPVNHRRIEDYDRNVPISKIRKYLGPIFAGPTKRIIGHNIKFDMHVLERNGIHIVTRDLYDTMIMAWLCDENTPNGLKDCSMMYLGISQQHFKEAIESVPKDIKKEFGLKASNKATFDLVLIDEGAPYALSDSFYTWELYLGFIDLIEHEGMLKVYKHNYQPFIRTLFKMEERGTSVDVNKLEEMSKEIDEDVEELKYQMYEIAGVEFNPDSNIQLAELFFGYQPEIIHPSKAVDKSGICHWKELSPAEKQKAIKLYDEKVAAQGNSKLMKVSFDFHVLNTTGSGAPSTNGDTFWKITQMSFKNKRKREGVQVANLLLEYKKLSKLKSAFVDGMREQLYDDGKAHPSFNIIGTDSGRISCSSPNLQQLPKADEEDKYQIRSLFIGSFDVPEHSSKRKKIISVDFSNLEMRVLAHFSEDKNLLNMFASGADTHGSTAVNMFNLDCDPSEVKKKYPHLRQAAKVLNFLLMYGGGAQRLYEQLKGDHNSAVDLGSKEYLELYKCKNGLEVAQVYIDKYFDTYSGVAKFIRDQKRFAHKYGYVQTLLQRKRRLPDINSSDMKLRSYCERLAVNSTVQGSAADITSSAQNRIDADPWFVEHRCLMILQVHDELVFECPEEYVEEAIPRIQRYMSHPFGDNVELNLEFKADADSGDSYQEAK